MNIADILKLPDKTSVDQVSGTVKGVYTKNPTANQKKAGIHPQDVVIIDDDGYSIRVVLMKEKQHIPVDSKGASITIESTAGDGGKPIGLWTDLYNNVVKLQADGACAISMKDGPAKQAPSEPDTKPDKVPEAGAPVQQTGRIGWEDHVDCLVEIVKRMDEKLQGMTFVSDTAYPDYLTRLSTTVYIQAAKDNLVRRPRAIAQAVVQMVEKAQEEEAPQPVLKPKAVLAPSDVVFLAFTGALTTKAIEELHAAGRYDWESIYDMLEQKLIADKGLTQEAINSAYDETKGYYVQRTKRFDNSEFCRVILSGVDSFIETAQSKNTKPTHYRQPAQNTTANEDDIPFL